MLDFETARARLLEQARETASIERVRLQDTLGRVLAAPVDAPCDIPPNPSSALDGYAIRTADLSAGGPTVLRVTQRITAGSRGGGLARGEAARIFTGAAMPVGADAVVPQEAALRKGDFVHFHAHPAPLEDVRQKGCDLFAGERILHQGRLLRPQDIALAASAGVATLPVYRPLRIALLCTGNELREPGDLLPEGCTYDSNRYLIPAQIKTLGMDVLAVERVEDTLEATMDAMSSAMTMADVIMTTGGVSVGEEDHVREAIKRLGQIHIWRVNMKPGKPFTFAMLGEARTPLIGLPGNPVSAFLNFALFARPFLLRMQGMVDDCQLTLSLPAGFVWPTPSKRREFLRARVDPCDPLRRVSLYPHQGSSALKSASWANGIAVIPEGQTLSEGDCVEFIPLSSMNLF
ncbi:MAG: gephyrin-like molybdotransferase Glp [Pseudomonadota bacterium]